MLFKKKREDIFVEGYTKRRYICIYTILFISLCLVVFSWHHTTNKTFIYSSDGWQQHYPALVYYARYLREILSELLFEHKLIIPQWSFELGEGADILTTLHYYVIGDPFTVLSVFVPSRYMYLFYDGMILLRLYFSGLFFSFFCFETGKKRFFAVLTGAVSYVFCGYALFSAVRHPFFVNPMVYLPLILIGIEKILVKKKPWFFILAVFISAVSNFYFFYVLVILTVVYVIVRLFFLYRGRIKKMWVPFLKIAGASVVGLMLSAVIILPVCYAFISDSRMSSGFTFDLLYPSSYYKSLPALFYSNGVSKWLVMAYSIPTFFAVCLMFKKKRQYGALKVFFAIGCIFMLFPVFGQILNGFSYQCNRWCFAFAFLVSYILVLVWSDMMAITRREACYLLGCTTIYCIACMMLEETKSLISSILIMFLCFILLMLNSNLRKKIKLSMQPCILLVAIISIVNNSFWLYSPADGATDYAAVFVDKDKAADPFTSEADAVKRIADKEQEFYRYSGRSLTPNNLLTGLSGTAFYWTISNPYTGEFRNEINIREYSLYQFTNYDDSAELNTLAAVKYYVIPEADAGAVPYGFVYKDTISLPEERGRFTVYENTYTLPLGYTSVGYISEKTYDMLSSVEKREAMLQGVVIDQESTLVGKIEPRTESKKLPYTVSCDGVKFENNSFVVHSQGSSVVLQFDKIPKSETYVSIRGLVCEGIADGNETGMTEVYPIFFQSSENTIKYMHYFTETYSWHNGRQDFDINAGYSEEGITEIRITFPNVGIYHFNSLEIINKSMENFDSQVELLKQDILEDVEISTDKITGTISVEKPKILCMQIPYSIGWNCYVDGKKVEVFRVSTRYMGIELEDGVHQIQWEYHTPFLREGIYISSIGILMTLIIGVADHIMIRRKNVNYV